MNDREKIRQLEARVSELEAAQCCCCKPVVVETDGYVSKVTSNYDYPHGYPQVFVHVASPWGDIKVPVEQVRSCGLANHKRRVATLRLEIK